jgi:hypothetical protein
MHETWKDVVGFEGIYSVSDTGRVRRDKPENNTFAGRILRPDFPAGYVQYTLYKDGIRFRFKAHQLVASAFIGSCPEGKQINHKDGNKRNNQPANLEYVTGLENHQHATQMGLRQVGENTRKSKLTNAGVRFIRQHHQPYHKEFGLLPLSKRFKVNQTTITSALQGKTWKCVPC